MHRHCDHYFEAIDIISKKDRQIEELRNKNRQLRAALESAKAVTSAVVARSINARSGTKKKRYRKPGRKVGHRGESRKGPAHIDCKVEVNQAECSTCGDTLSDPTDWYTRTVEDIIPAKVVITQYTVIRRYCRTCKKQVSAMVPYALPNEHFGLRLMLLVVALKLLGLSYEKIGGLFKLLFNLDITEAAVNHAVTKMSEAFGSRYEELKEELGKEFNINGDETSWRINGKNHWLWAFVGRWTVLYEVDQSRGKSVPMRILDGYDGCVTSDSWSAWNSVGASHQRCHVHYTREIDDTVQYKNPGKEFERFAKKLKRILHDSQKTGRRYRNRTKRMEVKARLEKRVAQLIVPGYSDKHCRRFVKRLRRERQMLFTFLEKDGIEYHNNTAERAIWPCVVIRKITSGNKSIAGARAQAVLMSVKETCIRRGQNFYDHALECLGASKR